MIIESTRFCRWPKPTLTNAERIEAWRRKYQRVPIELQCAPIRKSVGFDELLDASQSEEASKHAN